MGLTGGHAVIGRRNGTFARILKLLNLLSLMCNMPKLAQSMDENEWRPHPLSVRFSDRKALKYVYYSVVA